MQLFIAIILLNAFLRLDALICYECVGLTNWNCASGTCEIDNGFCKVSRGIYEGADVVWTKGCEKSHPDSLDVTGHVCSVANGPRGLNLTVCYCNSGDLCNEDVFFPPTPISTTQTQLTTTTIPPTLTIPTEGIITETTTIRADEIRSGAFVYPWNGTGGVLPSLSCLVLLYAVGYYISAC